MFALSRIVNTRILLGSISKLNRYNNVLSIIEFQGLIVAIIARIGHEVLDQKSDAIIISAMSKSGDFFAPMVGQGSIDKLHRYGIKDIIVLLDLKESLSINIANYYEYAAPVSKVLRSTLLLR